MQIKGRSTRVVLPLAGSAAAVVVGGAFATVAEAAPAAPEGDAGTFGSLRGVPGQFESCEAFFGFGKELVAFDVVDQGGPDGVAHAVPSDTQVIFVLEDQEGDVLECLPEELTEADYDDFFSGAPFTPPAFPGPGHYVYPSIELGENIDQGDFGQVDFVGFRVGTIPAGHTLVSPPGTEELDQSQLDGPALLFLDTTDPRTSAHIEAVAGAAAADAWDAIIPACDADSGTAVAGDDIEDAIAALDALTGSDSDALECGDVQDLNLEASIVLGLQQSIAYTETITLSLPVQATSTTAGPAPTSTTAAVSPATTARVLARTGTDRSTSLPVALVGVASIAGGALVLASRRLVRAGR